MGKKYFDDDYFVHVNVQNNDFDDEIDGGDIVTLWGPLRRRCEGGEFRDEQPTCEGLNQVITVADVDFDHDCDILD